MWGLIIPIVLIVLFLHVVLKVELQVALLSGLFLLALVYLFTAMPFG